MILRSCPRVSTARAPSVVIQYAVSAEGHNQTAELEHSLVSTPEGPLLCCVAVRYLAISIASARGTTFNSSTDHQKGERGEIYILFVWKSGREAVVCEPRIVERGSGEDFCTPAWRQHRGSTIDELRNLKLNWVRERRSSVVDVDDVRACVGCACWGCIGARVRDMALAILRSKVLFEWHPCIRYGGRGRGRGWWW